MSAALLQGARDIEHGPIRGSMADEDSGDGALPPGWAWARLEDICEINPRTYTTILPEDAEVAFVPMAAVQELSGRLDGTLRRPLGEVSKGFTRFASGDVIFAKITPCMENGKIAVVPDLPFGVGFGSTEFHVIRPRYDIDAGYVFHFLAASRFRQEASRNMTGAVGQRRVPTDYMRAAPVPVPPAAEQVHIVARIDDLFGEIEAGEQELEKAREGLAAYRRSVLKAAVTGELTRDWREQNAPNETGADLLKRILIERRAAWERSELPKMAAKGQKPKGDTWKAKYVEPSSPDASGLPELPKQWTWATPHQLRANQKYALAIGPFGSDLKVSDYKADGVPLVFVRHIRARKFDGLNMQFVSAAKAEKLKAHQVSPGDLLVTKMGDPPGDAALYPPTLPDAIITADCIKWTTAPNCDALFLEFAMNSPIGNAAVRKITKGVAQQKVTLAGFSQIALPLPPLDEQIEIIRRFSELLSQANDLGEQLEREEESTRSLRQAVLNAAFTGKLVSQDPHDEAANMLLARLSKAKVSNKPNVADLLDIVEKHTRPLRSRRKTAA